MPRGQEGTLPVGVPADRRKGADRRRLRELEVARVLGATAAGKPGYLTIRGVDQENAPVQVTLPVEAAVTLLNDLKRLSDEGGWFDLQKTPDE